MKERNGKNGNFLSKFSSYRRVKGGEGVWLPAR
jgi:hypothetical protein